MRNCRICDCAELELVIDLGSQPWCNNFLRPDQLGSEPYYPLRVVYCHRCAGAQLDYTVPKEVMFADHTYLSGTTRSLARHFDAVAEIIDGLFVNEPRVKGVLDIGSNDGTQLKAYQKRGYDVLGIDSSATAARIANAAGVPTLNEYFNESAATRIGRTFDVVNASGVFFHLEELHSVTEGIRQILKPSGVFVVQCLYMKSIVENAAFDQIYHEHLLYYTLQSLETLLALHGLEVFDAWVSPIHGGSLLALVSHRNSRARSARLDGLRAAEAAARSNERQTYLDLNTRIAETKARDLEYLERRRLAGKRVMGLGAPAKGNTLLNHFSIGPTLLEGLVERNELRRGLYSPGMHIPVVLEDELRQAPDSYYVLAWNFRDEILARHATDVQNGVEFYFPITPSTVPS